MGLIISTDEKGIRVIRKDGTSKAGNAYTMYSLMYSYKNNEEWKNVFVDCAFRKGTDLSHLTKIRIKDAFMTGTIKYINRVPVTLPKIFVLDYEVLEGGVAPKPSADDFLMIPDGINSDFPFE